MRCDIKNVYSLEFYDFDGLFDLAMDCGCGSPELKAKDNARWFLESVLRYNGVDLDGCECIEDEIFSWLSEHSYAVLFDIHGNYVGCFNGDSMWTPPELDIDNTWMRALSTVQKYTKELSVDITDMSADARSEMCDELYDLGYWPSHSCNAYGGRVIQIFETKGETL